MRAFFASLALASALFASAVAPALAGFAGACVVGCADEEEAEGAEHDCGTCVVACGCCPVTAASPPRISSSEVTQTSTERAPSVRGVEAMRATAEIFRPPQA